MDQQPPEGGPPIHPRAIAITSGPLLAL